MYITGRRRPRTAAITATGGLVRLLALLRRRGRKGPAGAPAAKSLPPSLPPPAARGPRIAVLRVAAATLDTNADLRSRGQLSLLRQYVLEKRLKSRDGRQGADQTARLCRLYLNLIHQRETTRWQGKLSQWETLAPRRGYAAGAGHGTAGCAVLRGRLPDYSGRAETYRGIKQINGASMRS